jgi:hypothetical protein
MTKTHTTLVSLLLGIAVVLGFRLLVLRLLLRLPPSGTCVRRRS